MPGDALIFGNLRNLYPGGIPESQIRDFWESEDECPPGTVPQNVQCFAAPCPALCVPESGYEITDEQPSHVRIVHPFGEDPLDWVRLGALVVGVWYLWRYAKRNRR